MGESDEHLYKCIRHYQGSLERYSEKRNDAKLMHAIEKLFKLPIKVSHLEATGVGRTVNGLRKLGGDVSNAAKSLVAKWKEMVVVEEDKDKEEETKVSESENENDDEHDVKDRNREETSSSQKSRDKHNKNHSDSRSHKHGRNGKHDDKHISNKRKYDSEDDDSESESDSDDDDHESNKNKHSDSSSIDESDSDSGNRKRRRSDSSESEESDDEDSRRKMKKTKSIKDQYDSDNKKPSHKSKKNRYSDDSDEDDTHSKSRRKNKHYDNSDDEKQSRRNKSKSKSENKSKVSAPSDSEDTSSKRDKSNSKSTSKSSRSRNEADSKHSSSKGVEKDSKHKQPEKSTSKKDPEKSTSKSDKHKESKHHKENKQDKENKNVDKKNKTSDKSKKDDSKKLDKKSENSESNKKQSSSSNHSKSSHSKSEEKHTKQHKTSKEKHKNEDSVKSSSVKLLTSDKTINGIDSGSGASFAEALGMCGATPIIKKKPVPEKSKSHSSPKSSSSKKERNEISSKREKFDCELPKQLKEPVNEPLEINIESLLPSITNNYKPLGNTPFDNPMKKTLTDYEALSRVITSKNQRTRVYSGNKVAFGKVPTLFELCVRILQDNIDALEYTGGVPYSILKPILEKANADQLYMMEHHNPYLIEDTDELWQLHCQKEFKTKMREEMETWRDMYIRCLDEREAKLKALTANIKQSQDKSLPIRTTKLAYVDSIVKPPREVVRKQIRRMLARRRKLGTKTKAPFMRNGTAFDKKPAQTPASRLAALATSGDAGKIAVPSPGVRAAESSRSSSSSSAMKPAKKAPLMQKTLSFMKNRFKR